MVTLYHTITTFLLPTLYREPSENIMGKGENAGQRQKLLF